MLIIIQARFNSKRLPGKVLKNCHGKPLIKWTLDRLVKLRNYSEIVIATSNMKSDDLIYKFCINNNFNCFRGSLNNVIKRMIDACKEYKSSHFIRICADSPIIDSQIIEKAIRISKDVDADIITNTFPRTFPKGQSVELIKLSSLENLLKKNLTLEEKEHVTMGFYKRASNYNILNFEASEKDFSNIQLSVDTEEDFQKIQFLIKLEDQKKHNRFLDWQEFALLSRKFYG